MPFPRRSSRTRSKHSHILGGSPTAASGLRESKKNNEERGGFCAGKQGLLAGRYWPLARFVAPKADKFCLFPAGESGGPIQFEPEDVTLLCYQASIGDQFYVEEFFPWAGIRRVSIRFITQEFSSRLSSERSTQNKHLNSCSYFVAFFYPLCIIIGWRLIYVPQKRMEKI